MQKPEAARKANSNVFPNKLTSNKNLHSPIDRIGWTAGLHTVHIIRNLENFDRKQNRIFKSKIST